jgi:hypothetical protein
MYKYFLLLILILFFSCEKEQIIGGFYDASVEIRVQNENGNNLLDPSTPGAIDPEEITLYWLQNGEPKKKFDSFLDYPKYFRIIEEPEYIIEVQMNSDENEEFPVTYIRWNESDTDTIKCEFTRTTGTEYCSKLWCNNELMWEAYATKRFITVTK